MNLLENRFNNSCIAKIKKSRKILGNRVAYALSMFYYDLYGLSAQIQSAKLNEFLCQIITAFYFLWKKQIFWPIRVTLNFCETFNRTLKKASKKRQKSRSSSSSSLFPKSWVEWRVIFGK